MDITSTEVVIHVPGRAARRQSFSADTFDALRQKVERWRRRQDPDAQVTYAGDYAQALPTE